MIELPWQVAVCVIVSGVAVVIALILQIRDRADREHQRAGMIDRMQEVDIERVIRLIRLGYETRQKLRKMGVDEDEK